MRESSSGAPYSRTTLSTMAVPSLVIRSPSHPGTRILPDNGVTHGVIRAVTAFKGQQMITVEGRGMLGVPGTRGLCLDMRVMKRPS